MKQGKKCKITDSHSPTTCRTLLAVAVENGDSVVTSHETLPFKLKSTLRKVTWVAFDTDNCSDTIKQMTKNVLEIFFSQKKRRSDRRNTKIN